jgi:L-cysteine S-thiosulfotransferase
MSSTLQALQDDPVRNPARLWVDGGAARWRTAAGSSGKSCQDCHGAAMRTTGEPAAPSTGTDAVPSLGDAAVRHPAWGEREGRALTLEQRVAACRTRRQGVAADALDGDTTMALHAHLVDAAKGRAIAPANDARMQTVRDEGRRLFDQRMGQLDLSCADCHDRHAGKRLGGSVIPQAHPTGYPQYRLQWQAMGTLERRLRNCMTGVRATPWPSGDAAWVALEAYLMQRAAGMPIESAAVRP